MDVLNTKVLPPNCQEFLHLVSSKPFCLLLAHMTELELVENVIKPDSTTYGVNGDSSNNANEPGPIATSSSSTETNDVASSSSLELSSTALCRTDFYSWQSRNYVLAGDPEDPGKGKFCLEVFLSFNSEGVICYRYCKDI